MKHNFIVGLREHKDISQFDVYQFINSLAVHIEEPEPFPLSGIIVRRLLHHFTSTSTATGTQRSLQLVLVFVQSVLQQGLACRLLHRYLKAAAAGQTKGSVSPAPQQQMPRKRPKDSKIMAGRQTKVQGPP